MAPNYARRARIGGYTGLALQPLAILVLGSIAEIGQSTVQGMLGVSLYLLSIGLLDWGIWNYAKSKGYGNAVAALSLFGVYGLLIIALLPNKNRSSSGKP